MFKPARLAFMKKLENDKEFVLQIITIAIYYNSH